jgi:hypothetical protein
MISSLVLSSLEFITPPICQGQAVEYSYATTPTADSSPVCILRRRREYGEPDQYALFEDPEWEMEHSTNHDFWEREPRLGKLVSEWTTP